MLKNAAENKWTFPQLAKERDTILEKPHGFEDRVKAIIKALPIPKTLPSQLKIALENGVTALCKDMKVEFKAGVKSAVKIAVKARRKTLLKLQDEAQKIYDRNVRLGENEKGLMSREEFYLIRSCLHPDRHSNDRRYAKAFDTFNKLEASVPKKLSPATASMAIETQKSPVT